MKYYADFRSTRVLLFTVFCFALLVRAITVLVLKIQPESDYAAYQVMAQNLISGIGLTDEFNKAFMSPGYPLFVLAPVFALTGNSFLAAQLTNAFLGGISVLLCYFVARQAGADRAGGLIAASLLVLYVPSWIYAEYLAKENLMTPLMLGIAWCALCLHRQSSYKVASLCGFLFGLLALVGNAALSTACAVLLALVLSRATPMRRIFSIGIITVVAITAVSPWLIRNYSEIGAPVINSNSGFNLYIGNNPSATGYFVSISDTPIGAEWHSLRNEYGELEASKHLGKLALAWIKENPSETLILGLKKAVLFWMPPVHSGKGDTSVGESVTRLVWLLQFLILTIASVGSLAFQSLRTRQMSILWSAVIGYTAVHMIFYVVFRYREPIMPFLCVLSAFTLSEIWQQIKLKKLGLEIIKGKKMESPVSLGRSTL